MALTTFAKDPDASLDYTVDWTSWLASGETISTVAWTVQSGLSKGTESKTDKTATVWLSGGTAGTTYTVECKVTTSQSRIDVRSFDVAVQNR